MVANCMCQFQSVHRARHIDVGEHRPNVRTFFQHLNGIISVGGFQGGKACVFNDVDRAYPNKRLVINDQDNRLIHSLARVLPTLCGVFTSFRFPEEGNARPTFKVRASILAPSVLCRKRRWQPNRLPEENNQKAIADGKSPIKEGKAKFEAATAMYEKLQAADRETVEAAFVEWAGLTKKGALI